MEGCGYEDMYSCSYISLPHEHYWVVNPALKTDDLALDITWTLSWGE